MRLEGPEVYLKPTISQPTLAAVGTYLDSFARDEFQFEVSREEPYSVRFADRRDGALLGMAFPEVLDRRSRP